MPANWDDIRCFTAVAEGGSLTAAARETGLSVATLGRRVSALEAVLGLRLLDRTPTGALPTAEGLRVLDFLRPGAERFAEVERLAGALSAGLDEKPVRVSTAEPVIAEILAPALPDLRRRDPRVRVELAVSTALVNLNKREADLAVRLARPTVETLVARRLADIEIGCYASPDYLRGRDPENLALGEDRWLLIDDTYGDIPEVLWAREHGFDSAAVLRSSSTRALLNAARVGGGIATLPRFIAERYDLVRVAAPKIPTRQPWLVFHRDMRHLAAVQTVRDWIVDACRNAVGAKRVSRRR